MQEGHFDSEGNYFIKKDQEIRDNWLDNIDWVRKQQGCLMTISKKKKLWYFSFKALLFDKNALDDSI